MPATGALPLTTPARVGACCGLKSTSVAPSVVIAALVATPWAMRAITNTATSPAAMNSAIAAISTTMAAKSTGRRPTWSDRPPTMSIDSSMPTTYTAKTTVSVVDVNPHSFWYTTYSGDGALAATEKTTNIMVTTAKASPRLIGPERTFGGMCWETVAADVSDIASSSLTLTQRAVSYSRGQTPPDGRRSGRWNTERARATEGEVASWASEHRGSATGPHPPSPR